MADFYLPRGGIVLVDDEDLEVLEDETKTWRLWRYRSSAPFVVIRDECNRGAVFRVMLHREIAARIQPKITDDPKLFRIRARNGNFQDVRRENLEVVYTHPGSGRRPKNRKPSGYRRYQKGEIENPRPTDLWSGGLVWKRDKTHASRGTSKDSIVRPWNGQRFID